MAVRHVYNAIDALIDVFLHCEEAAGCVGLGEECMQWQRFICRAICQTTYHSPEMIQRTGWLTGWYTRALCRWPGDVSVT
jgi:hypothetical protein